MYYKTVHHCQQHNSNLWFYWVYIFSNLFCNKKTHVVQWLGLCTFTAIGQGFILDQGTKILQAMWPDQKKKKKKQHVVFVFMCIVNFTQHNILRVHPYCHKWQNFLLFSGQIMFQCMCVSRFLYLFIYQWTFRLFPYLSYCEWCCNKHGSGDNTLRSWFCFLWIIIPKWDCFYSLIVLF